MKISKKILGTASAVALLTMANVTAQEDDGFGDFAEEYTEPALTFNGEAGANGRTWINTKQGYSSSKDDSIEVGDTDTQANAYLKLDLNYSGANSDLNGKIKLDTATIKDNPEDVIEEISARGYFGNWQVEAGKIKNVWGKGDKIHVLDNFNANNYTDFIFPDYIDRRLAEPMLKVTYASTYSNDSVSDIKLEFIGTPMMTADRFASKGALKPYSMTKLENSVKTIAGVNLASKFDAANGTNGLPGLQPEQDYLNTLMNSTSLSADSLTENTKRLKYGQFGTRVTCTVSGFDLGASYYYGHYKQPSVNMSKYLSSKQAAMSDLAVQGSIADLMADGKTQEKAFMGACILKHKELALPSLDYDQLQVFGLEAAFVLWKFNTRWELAYNLTKDTKGDDPFVKNNSIAWVGGFDMDLPIHNVNINIQEQGKLVLKKDKIEDGSYKTYDVDYNSDGKYTNNQIVVNISDKFLNEKLTPECTTIYVFETKEWCVQPKVSYNVFDGLTFTLSGAYVYSNNQNGQFYNFTSNDDKNHSLAFIQLAAKYQF